ncbi:exopolyphosphatase PRUNE1-like [Portunus trituberculatus]|uniref:exopolyphosphatase PRUNE1-like n=1 Tax=Portunus trituberculatus TaxID=210409 RepID=UPI001E1CD997|nr:exopolyphosphatase PRUNE1-like [Portunus trituberculatus]
MCPIVDFMNAIKKTLSARWPALHVVLGNESCDLDSAVSAIVYAFLLHSLQNGEEAVGVVPVLNIPAGEYPLKTEVTHWLQKHGILQNSLIFRDEVNLSRLQEGGSLRVTLVDHHVLPPADAYLESSVVGVLDHRPLDPNAPTNERVTMIVEPVGSCCTLVAEQVMAKNPALLDPVTASLLYGTIILDTVNLNPAAKRVTPKDIEVASQLARLMSPPPSSFRIVHHASGGVQELTEAKADVSGLTCDQLLRKDLKVATGGGLRVGVASVPLRVTDFLGRSEGGRYLAEHLVTQGYQMLLVLGVTITQETVTRDLAVYCPDTHIREQVTSALVEGQGGVLQLAPQECEDVEGWVAFRQGNVGASRKVVMPILKAWLATRTS